MKKPDQDCYVLRNPVPGLFIAEHHQEWQTRPAKQRYLYKGCRHQFICAYTYLGCIGDWRALIVPLTMNGTGIRDIGRVLSISHHTVLKTLHEAAAQVTEPTPFHAACALWNSMNSGRPCGTKKQQRWTYYG